MELIVDRLTKHYKNKIAVDRISLKLNHGVYGLLGENGAGKTTLMRMLSGVLKPTSGEISFNGIDVSHEDYREVLGYLPQKFGYYPEFSAMDFMMYLAALKGLPKAFARLRSKELLEMVSLSDVGKKKIKTFSGGMIQRLGIAQAMLNKPKILILDEPTAGLDPKERVRFRNIISKLGEECIVLLSTHIVSDIESIANTILIMKDGQLIHQGALHEIIGVIDNNVWEVRVTQAEADKLMKKYSLINMKIEEKEVLLRLVAKQKPSEEAICVSATLEDLYLYYFSEVSDYE